MFSIMYIKILNCGCNCDYFPILDIVEKMQTNATTEISKTMIL